jgi:proline racemase
MASPISTLEVIDAHAGGQPLRLITAGVRSPVGATMVAKAEWMARHDDVRRRMAVSTPRGHLDMTAALLTEPVTAGAAAGLLFMDSAGYPRMSGHGVVAAVTVAIERGLLTMAAQPGPDIAVSLDTCAGLVIARASIEPGSEHPRVGAVTVTHTPAFVHEAGRLVTCAGRRLRVDLAFCGAFFAICDSEATGVPLALARLPALRALGMEICAALDRGAAVVHPHDATVSGVTSVVFTGPAADAGAHLRSVTVSRDGAADVAGCGLGAAAVMAVLEAMGLMTLDQMFVHEGLGGAIVRGRAVRRAQVDETWGIVPEMEDSAWITGDQHLVAEEDDPWRAGPPS